jgi:3-methylcrotonyl-CoA carboxylase alpha subunit
MTSRELHWRIGDEDVSCRIEQSDAQGTFYLSDSALPFRILDSTHIEISGKRHRFYVVHHRDSSTVWLEGHTYHLGRARKTSEPNSAKGEPATGEIRALMPGKLLRFTVDPGDAVTEKQIVAIMESMKMESALFAPIAGRVAEIRFKPGDVVEMGDTVMVIEIS